MAPGPVARSGGGRMRGGPFSVLPLAALIGLVGTMAQGVVLMTRHAERQRQAARATQVATRDAAVARRTESRARAC